MHFPTKNPSGEIIDDTHRIFDDFPTEKYPDYQWKELLDNAKCADISSFPEVSPIVEVVPNFVDCTPVSPLFEVSIGKARLVFCGFDLSKTDLPTKQLKSAIFRYVNALDSDMRCITVNIDRLD